MLVSQRFILRGSKLLGVDIPDDADLVTDAIVLRISAVSGGHQRVFSVARCQRLTNTCLGNIHRFVGLQHLNLSWTGITNLESLSTCVNLRSFSLAGVNLVTYEGLQFLTSIEVLNLQYSNFSKPELFKDFYLLRSLDLGNSMIQSTDNLAQFTRLEELYIDSTYRLKPDSIDVLSKSLRHLTSLKLLQVGDSEFVNHITAFNHRLTPQTTLMTKPRR